MQNSAAQCIKNEYKYLKFKRIGHYFSSTKFLSNSYNTASVAFLTHMVAQQCGFEPGEVIISVGDLHLYKNHLEQAKLQLTREPRPLPKLVIKRKTDSIFDYKFEDFEIVGYDPHPHISAPIEV
jgi:thymidylate synthase